MFYFYAYTYNYIFLNYYYIIHYKIIIKKFNINLPMAVFYLPDLHLYIQINKSWSFEPIYLQPTSKTLCVTTIINTCCNQTGCKNLSPIRLWIPWLTRYNVCFVKIRKQPVSLQLPINLQTVLTASTDLLVV